MNQFLETNSINNIKITLKRFEIDENIKKNNINDKKIISRNIKIIENVTKLLKIQLMTIKYGDEYYENRMNVVSNKAIKMIEIGRKLFLKNHKICQNENSKKKTWPSSRISILNDLFIILK